MGKLPLSLASFCQEAQIARAALENLGELVLRVNVVKGLHRGEAALKAVLQKLLEPLIAAQSRCDAKRTQCTAVVTALDVKSYHAVITAMFPYEAVITARSTKMYGRRAHA